MKRTQKDKKYTYFVNKETLKGGRYSWPVTTASLTSSGEY